MIIRLLNILKSYIALNKPVGWGKNKAARWEKDAFKEVTRTWLNGLKNFSFDGEKVVYASSIGKSYVETNVFSSGDYDVYTPKTYHLLPPKAKQQIVFCTLNGSYSGYDKYLFVHKDWDKLSNGERSGEYSWNSYAKDDFYSIIDVAIGADGTYANFKSNHGDYNKKWLEGFTYKNTDQMISLRELRETFDIDISVKVSGDSSFYTYLTNIEGSSDIINCVNSSIYGYIHGNNPYELYNFRGTFWNAKKEVTLFYLPNQIKEVKYMSGNLKAYGAKVNMKYWWIDKYKDPIKYYTTKENIYSFYSSLLPALRLKRSRRIHKFNLSIFKTLEFASNNSWKVFHKRYDKKEKGLGHLEDLNNYLKNIYDTHFKNDEGLVFVPKTNEMFKVIENSIWLVDEPTEFYLYRDNKLQRFVQQKTIRYGKTVSEGVVGITESLDDFKEEIKHRNDNLLRHNLEHNMTGHKTELYCDTNYYVNLYGFVQKDSHDDMPF